MTLIQSNPFEIEDQAVAKDLAYRLMPSLWVEKATGFVPDPWQEDFFNLMPKKALLCCSRQTGKTTIISLAAIYEAIFNPGAEILIISSSQRQSFEMLRKLKASLSMCDIGIDFSSALRVELANGSRILALPGKEETIRGFSKISLIVIDEASRVTDDLYRSIRPMLAVSSGRMYAMTTPWGRRGWFYDAWRGDDSDDWYKVKVTAYDCPRITEEFLTSEMNSMGSWWFRQEYMCEFIDTADQLFGIELLESCVVDNEHTFELPAEPMGVVKCFM
jgi:hypothetical protein